MNRWHRRVISFVLAIALIIGLTLPVLAEEDQKPGGEGIVTVFDNWQKGTGGTTSTPEALFTEIISDLNKYGDAVENQINMVNGSFNSLVAVSNYAMYLTTLDWVASNIYVTVDLEGKAKARRK